MPLGVITVISGELKGSQYFVADGQTMVIGRSKDSNIVMPLSYSHVSRHHCTIAYDGVNGKFYVVDTSSTGVYNSNGHHMKSEGYVSAGSILWIGDNKCMIQLSIVTDYQVDNTPADNGSYGRNQVGNAPADNGSYDRNQVGNIPADNGSYDGYSAGSNYSGNGRGRRGASGGRRLKKENKALTFTVIFAALLIVCCIAGGLIYRMNSAVDEMQQAFMPTGGLYRDDKPVDSAEISQEEQEERTRYNEEYEENQTTDDQLLINNAPEFYYYTQLNQDEKEIYDCIYKLAHNPTDANYSVEYHSNINPQSTEFNDMVGKVEYCVNYDHPETFWFYNGCRTRLYFECIGNDVYFKFSNPYTDFQSDMEDFNDSVSEFLSDIDRSKSQAEMALDIHDKLIHLVTYDNDALDDQHGSDAAHTAFGALVRNDSKVANYAVCDGYSQAYVYLLQQVGIEAVVIAGYGGHDENDLGGHAWNAVYLDGDWYEVDSTWDDFGTVAENVGECSKKDKKAMDEISADEEYLDRFEHFLYNVTTEKMSKYEMDKDYSYVTSDGYNFDPNLSCVHVRATTDCRLHKDGMVMEIAPIAYGTKYRYH